MEDHYKKRVTKTHLKYVLEIINVTSGWLYSRIEKSVIERMREEEISGAPPPQAPD